MNDMDIARITVLLNRREAEYKDKAYHEQIQGKYMQSAGYYGLADGVHIAWEDIKREFPQHLRTWRYKKKKRKVRK